MNTKFQLSIIIPIFNEEKNIKTVLENLIDELKKIKLEFEIIAVNDGSIDDSKKKLEQIFGIKTINHPYNKGYGAALKTGIKHARNNWLLFFDADGQHNPNDINKLLRYTNDYDLIAGDRSQGKYIRPTLRKPGLWLLNKIANYLVSYKIPDLNCGIRLVKKNSLIKYLHLMPSGFSMSTTSTLAFLKDKQSVKFVPVEINKRNENSKSTVRPRHAITTLMLIFRLIMVFSPMRIFFPISIALFMFGSMFLIYDLSKLNISETSIFIFLTSILIFFFGLIADQIAALRREINK